MTSTIKNVLTLDHITYLSRVFLRKTLSSSRNILTLDSFTESNIYIANEAVATLPAITKVLDIRCQNPDASVGLPLKVTLNGLTPVSNTSETYILYVQGRLCITGAFTGVVLTNPNLTSTNLDPISCSIIYS